MVDCECECLLNKYTLKRNVEYERFTRESSVSVGRCRHLPQAALCRNCGEVNSTVLSTRLTLVRRLLARGSNQEAICLHDTLFIVHCA